MTQMFRTISVVTLSVFLLSLNRRNGVSFADESPVGLETVLPDYDQDGGGGGVSDTSVNVNPGPVVRGRQRLISQWAQQRQNPRLDNRQRVDEILRPKAKCDRRIRVLNGATRIRDKGALVRFQCSYGYHMLGVSLAVCVKGKWSDPPPICVRDGCKTLAIPVQGNLRQLYGGGVAVFSCNYGHYLEGERVLTCDGTKWNGTAPSCIEIPPVTLSPPSTTFPTIPLEMASPEPELEPKNKTAADPLATSPSASEEPDLSTSTPTSAQVESSSGSEVYSSTDGDQQPSVEHNTEAVTVSTEPENLPESSTTDFEESTQKDLQYLTSTEATSTKPAIPSTEIPTQSTSTTTEVPLIIEEVPKLTSTEAPTPKTTIESITTSTESLPETESTTVEAVTEAFIPTFTSEPTTVSTTEVPTTTSSSTQRTSTSTSSTTTTTTDAQFLPSLPAPTTSTESTVNIIKTYGYPTKRPETRKEKESRKQNSENETRKELISIVTPSKLDDGHHIRSEQYTFAHTLIIAGTVLITIGFVSILGGLFMYCWRKNKGIARARSNDLDGRTLSYNEGNEEITWLDARDIRA